MDKTCLKLKAQRIMHKNILRLFLAGALPFFITILLISVLFYFITVLKITAVISAVFIAVSFLSVEAAGLFSKNCFFNITGTKNKITISQYFSYITVRIIRFLLSASWSAVYFLPCVVMAGLLIYCYRYERYEQGLSVTLFVSAILLFVIGCFFLFVTMKRYSFCDYVLLCEKERNPLKIIARSIEMSENHCTEYALYLLSFAGWICSCVFVLPVIYVVPYVTMCRWMYFRSVNRKTVNNEKPVIFYIQKRPCDI